jgi:hypothetical protein
VVRDLNTHQPRRGAALWQTKQINASLSSFVPSFVTEKRLIDQHHRAHARLLLKCMCEVADVQYDCCPRRAVALFCLGLRCGA